MPTDPKVVRDLFLAVAELDAAEREEHLNAHCGGDVELRSAVERLLAGHDQPASVLNRPLPGIAEQMKTYIPNEHAGTLIVSRYKLLEEIGEGGMGTVWVAEQTVPVKRKVALKLIKAGMDSRSVLARFEAERQALAVMDHPNIAKVLDGGMTETGRPFFVMEYVKGVPITEYCDSTCLSVTERLELFIQVCSAVQHAHQKGIIHRDLKPSNILVAPYDDKPVPKVIDFGLAKAMHQALTDRTLHTAHETVLGTPLYMSPEQAQLNTIDVDTRADIYSLGVLLYELLTGSTPLEKQRIKEAAWDEVRRIIREEEPPRPSMRLSSADKLPSLAACRHTEPAGLTKQIRGDLDWIVMKALEKQRSRRYDTANGLVRDIQRFLADETVEARPPSMGYRLSKLVKRNKGSVIAMAAVAMAIVGGVAAVVAVQARANRDLAGKNIELAAKNAELADEQAKVQARFDLARKSIATFHTGISEEMLLKNDQFKELRTKLLKEAADFYGQLEKLLAGQTDAQSRKVLASGYFQLGELTQKISSPHEALTVHHKALTLRRDLATAPEANVETRLDVARSLLAVGQLQQTTADLTSALSSYEECRALLGGLVVAESEGDAARGILAECYYCTGALLQATSRKSDALKSYAKSQAIEEERSLSHPDNVDSKKILSWCFNDTGKLLLDTGKPEAALGAFVKSQQIKQKIAENHPEVSEYRRDLALSHTNVGIALSAAGKPVEALASYEAARAILQKLMEAYPAVTLFQRDFAGSYNNIGIELSATGKPFEALASYEASRAILQKLTEAYPVVTQFQCDLAGSYSNIGSALHNTGKSAGALASYEAARAILQKLIETHPTVTQFRRELAAIHGSLAWSQYEMGQAAKALDNVERSRILWQQLLDSESTNDDFRDGSASLDVDLTAALLALGRHREAALSIERAVAAREALVASHSQNAFHSLRLAECLLRAGQVRLAAGDPSDAATKLRHACEIYAKTPPPVDELIIQACCHAQLAGLAGRMGSGISADVGVAQAELAMATLRRALTGSYGPLDWLRHETALDPLRSRADFTKLLADLDAKAKKG